MFKWNFKRHVIHCKSVYPGFIIGHDHTCTTYSLCGSVPVVAWFFYYQLSIEYTKCKQLSIKTFLSMLFSVFRSYFKPLCTILCTFVYQCMFSLHFYFCYKIDRVIACCSCLCITFYFLYRAVGLPRRRNIGLWQLSCRAISQLSSRTGLNKLFF